MPRTGWPPMIGETPTTGASVAARAARTPGTASTGPMETTGLEGASTTTSAPPIASSTPGAGRAPSIPRRWKARAGAAARRRTHHSWKCTTSPVTSSTWVSTSSSLIGSSATPVVKRSHSRATTCEAVAPRARSAVRSTWVATSRSPRVNQVGSAPCAASSVETVYVSSSRPQPRSRSAWPDRVYITESRSG